MSTNSTITIKHSETDYESVYCHWDGYLEWNGQLLYAFYNTAEKVQELIDHGDLSSLGMNIGDKIDGLTFDARRVTNFQCEFYSRDRDEQKEIKHFERLEDISEEEFNYIFDEKEGIWYVYEEDMEHGRLLKDALIDGYRMRGYDQNYIFSSETAFSIPCSDNVVVIKDIATPEQLRRLDEVREEIIGEPKRELTCTRFDCDNDLSKYTDSLLFPQGETIVVADFKDKDGINVNLRVEVVGDMKVIFNGEPYYDPADFPDELIECIKNGDHGCDYDDNPYVEDGNWFNVEFTIEGKNGDEIAYDGDSIEVDISKMTVEEMKEYLADYAENCYDHYAEEIKDSKETAKAKQKNDAEREV